MTFVPPSRPPQALIRAIRSELATHANPEKAAPMQAYMKSEMPFLGVSAPLVKRICRDVFAAHPLPDAETWRETILSLFREATHREERYAALELAGTKRYAAYQDLDTLPMYEALITSGAWWDLVDGIATQRIGMLLARFPKRMKPLMRRYSRDENLWKRRTAIICQVKAKTDTDLDLLYGCIEPNLSDKDFFIRKAIGWALRAYAWTDPKEVARWVAEHESELSGLSKREALKNL